MRSRLSLNLLGVLMLVGLSSPGWSAINAFKDDDGNWVLLGRPEPRRSQPTIEDSSKDECFPDKCRPYQKTIDRICEDLELSRALVVSIIEVESGFNPTVVSRKGAKGLMQLMDETARDMGVGNVLDPVENIEGGCKYLRFLFDRFGDQTDHVLAGYNAGPSSVEKYDGIPPFQETKDYVRNVKARCVQYRQLDAEQQAAGDAPPPRRTRVPRPLRVYVDASGTIHLTNAPAR